MSRPARLVPLLPWIFAALTLGLAHPAFGLDRVGDILSRPQAFDGQEVVVAGTASAVDPRTSRKGNDYCTFRLLDETGALKVFSWGKPAVLPGDRIEVRGKFQRERRVGRYTFTNEIEASEIHKLP